MGIPGSANPLLLVSAAAAPTGYEITRSLRFNSGDSAYLNRTPSSAGNVDKWTWSGWVKRSKLGINTDFFSAIQGFNDATILQFSSSDRLSFENFVGGSEVGLKQTTQVFRDPSAWYHIVAVYDSGNSTADDRMKLFINGSRVTSFSSSTNPGSGQNSIVNSTNAHHIGSDTGFNNHYFDGLLADVHLIDGQALAATDFGEYDDNNVWQPKAFTFNNPNGGITWSNLGTFTNWDTVNYPKAELFDGVFYTGGTPNGATSSNSSAASFDFGSANKITGVTNIKVNIFLSSNQVGGTNLVSINGTDITAQCHAAGNDTWTTVDLGSSFTEFQSFSIASNDIYVGGFYVNGYPLIDGIADNSFHLDFSDATSTTTLGEDSSGNNNDWTLNNLVAGETSLATISASASPSGSTGFNSTYPGGNAIDSSDTTYATANYSTGDTTIVTVNFSPPLTAGSTLTAKIYQYDVYHSMKVNSGSYVTASSSVVNLLSGHGVSAGDSISSISYRTVSPTSVFDLGNQFYYIKNDGTNVLPTNVVDGDSLFDSPTNANAASDTGAGGEVSGNYATWNPICRSSDYGTFSNGNLEVAVTTNDYGYSSTIFVPDSGKWYFEITLSATSGNGPAVGIVSALAEATDMNDSSVASGLEYGGPVYAYGPGWSTNLFTQTTSTSWSGVGASTPATNDVYGIAVDFDNQAVYFSKNGTWLNSGDPTSGASKTGAAFTSIASGSYSPLLHAWGTGITGVLNTGQRVFNTTAPTGYQPLTTALLDDPTIADGSTAMDVATFSANGGTNQITGLNFEPDAVWLKSRSSAANHEIFDSVRGVSAVLFPNNTGSETTDSGRFSSFNSDGFTLLGGSNANGSGTSVGWCWDGGSSTVSNTNGSITSSVRANASAGFSIVKAQTASSNVVASYGHGLNAAPAFIIVKMLQTQQWDCYHQSLGNQAYIVLNSTAAAVTGATNTWNSTSPTSSVFTLGANYPIYYGQSNDFIAYCWAPVEGYSAFGSYTGNGSSDGPFVYTGHRSRFILLKKSSSAGGWYIYDTARSTYNAAGVVLQPHDSAAEFDSSAYPFDILSNGFKPRTSDSLSNQSGQTYIWASFAENPFKTARAR